MPPSDRLLKAEGGRVVCAGRAYFITSKATEALSHFTYCLP
jgi:hypothetical protein